jgi:amino acid adenylation domain-containing protein
MDDERTAPGMALFQPIEFDPFADGEVVLTAPSTEAQKEIWLSTQFGSEANCAFNESMSFRLNGILDVSIFRECLIEAINRHEAMRITFSPDGSTLSIASKLEIDIPVIDLADSADRQMKIKALITEEVTKPFDLVHGPLVRAKIIRLCEDQHHVLFTAHHIICDGWSMAIFIQDLKKLYSIRKNSSESTLSEPSLFSEYANEEYELIRDGRSDEYEKYWLGLYSQEIPMMEFPTDRPRPAMRTFDAGRVDHVIDAEIVRLLKKTASKFGCTFIVILVAAFKVFLFRLTSQKRIALGMPAAGQLATGRFHLVGQCVNLLPLVSTLKPSQSFSEYLKIVRDLMFDANLNQRYTFGSLIKKLKIRRDPSRIPLVPIIFNIDQQTKEDELKIDGIEFEVSSNPRKFENFELFMNLTSSATGHKVIIEATYNQNLFDEATIRCRLSEFEALLASIIDNPNQLLSDIPMLPINEKEVLFAKFNNTEMDYPYDKCFHNIFEVQVLSHPEKIAAKCHDQSITYAGLNQKANQLARYLVNAGVGPDVLVGIFMDRSIDMMIGLLGIMKAGGAYVPLDPEYPKERLSYMLGESRSPVLITQHKFKADLPESDAKVVFIDTDWDVIAEMDSENLDFTDDGRRPGPENLAYVIFTSGSTGKPKGVQIPHRALSNFLTAMSREPGLTAEDTLLAVTTLSFDIHVLELYLPLSVGGKVVIADRETAADGTRLVELLNSSGATIMQATPSTWRLMIAAEWKGSKQLKVLCGGEAFPRDLVRALLDRVGSVWNMYGPTETTVWSTCYRLTDSDGPILVGRPIGNTQTYVLDENRQAVPIGVPGELYIGGDGVTHGYLNRPDLTRKAFIPDSFSGRPDTFIYKTGDLVKYHPDGNIEYLNRLDNQVKVRGFRIELGEIEAVLGAYPEIQQAIAGVKEFGPGDQRLIGYYVPKKNRSVVVSDLYNHLRKKLPDYMVPQNYVELETFPLTPAGKIDRKSMPLPDDVSGGAAESYIPPENPTEKEIVQIWQDVLKIERVGIMDNFFKIGGHSLLGMQVVNRLRKRYSINLSVAAIFNAPTVEQMGRLIENKLSEMSMLEKSPNDAVSIDREVFEF